MSSATAKPKPTEDDNELAEAGSGDILNQVGGTLGWLVLLGALLGVGLVINRRRQGS